MHVRGHRDDGAQNGFCSLPLFPSCFSTFSISDFQIESRSHRLPAVLLGVALAMEVTEGRLEQNPNVSPVIQLEKLPIHLWLY